VSLDIQLQKMLDDNANSGGTGLQEMELAQAREALQQSFLNKGYPIKHPADKQHHIITGPTGVFSVDIYRPINRSQDSHHALPVLLYFHGGGFVLGDSQACEMHSRAFSYLLNVAVIDWLGENAHELSLDSQKIVTCGESAGGNLATHAAMYANTPSPSAIHNCKAIASTLFYPVTDLRPFYHDTPVYPSMQNYGAGFNLDIAELNWFWQHYLVSNDQADHPDNSLLLHD